MTDHVPLEIIIIIITRAGPSHRQSSFDAPSVGRSVGQSVSRSVSQSVSLSPETTIGCQLMLMATLPTSSRWSSSMPGIFSVLASRSL